MADPRLIPPSVADPSADVWDELAERIGTLDCTPLLVYLIDTAPTAALPALADQFRVTPFEWRLATTDAAKRAMIKTAIQRRRIKGTPGAIEAGLAALGLQGIVREWFEYGGDPGHFRVEINLNSSVVVTDTVAQDLSAMIACYKRLTAWLDSIDYIAFMLSDGPAWSFGCYSAGDTTVLPLSEIIDPTQLTDGYGVGLTDENGIPLNV